MSPQRVLIVASADVSAPEVRDGLAKRVRGASEVRVVAPATPRTVIERTMGDVDDAIGEAQKRVDRALDQLEEPDVVATGAIGDADLRLAIQDALQTFDADEIVIVAHKEDPPAQEHEAIADAEKSFQPPITELYVAEGRDREPRIEEVEEVGPGVQEVDPGEVELGSRNLPPFSVRDLAGIFVAIVGTGALFVLAAACETAGFQDGFDSCAMRLLLAGAFGLINIAHVIGLTLFQAGPYRGFWRSFFAETSLYGTPVAIVVSAFALG